MLLLVKTAVAIFSATLEELGNFLHHLAALIVGQRNLWEQKGLNILTKSSEVMIYGLGESRQQKAKKLTQNCW